MIVVIFARKVKYITNVLREEKAEEVILGGIAGLCLYLELLKNSCNADVFRINLT